MIHRLGTAGLDTVSRELYLIGLPFMGRRGLTDALSWAINLCQLMTGVKDSQVSESEPAP